MRWIVWLLLLLAVAGWLAAEAPLPTTPAPALSDTPWRRTRDGWEQATWLAQGGAQSQPDLHPAVVAIWQLLASILVLAAFGPVASQEARRSAPPFCRP